MTDAVKINKPFTFTFANVLYLHHLNVVYAVYTPVLRYMKVFYRKKNKYRYSVWTGLPPSTNLSFFFIKKKLLFLYSGLMLSWSSALLSQLHAGAGWTGMSAVSNGGMVEPGQGVNGTMLTNQTGMSTAGYPTHWSHTAVSEPEGQKEWNSAGGGGGWDGAR